MVTTAEYLMAKILCSGKNKFVWEKLNSWYNKGNENFIREAIKRTYYLIDQDLCDDHHLSAKIMRERMKEYCPQISIEE
jgi:hypothetical protein